MGGAQAQWTTLYRTARDFGSGTDGREPGRGAVVFDSSGDAFGTTEEGGENGCGMIWEITKSGTYTDLHDFGAGADGVAPVAGVTLDSSGNLYGTTAEGGANDCGMVWKLTSGGTYSDLWDFGSGTDGYEPCSGVTIDGSGNLYGTALRGGAYGAGMVWKLTAGTGYTDLHDFGSGYDGWYPESGVTLDSSGNLYGTVYAAGSNNGGLLWQLTTGGTYNTLHSFGSSSDGSNPIGGVTFDSLGNLYGTTEKGGIYGSGGVLWEYTTSGSYKVLHEFGSGLDGALPWAGVTVDIVGDLFGTTSAGGGQFGGTLWEYTSAGTYSTLYDFGAGSDGSGPWAGVSFDSSGNIFGTSSQGGVHNGGRLWEVLSWVKSLTISPSTVQGGQDATGTITLTQAPLGNLTIALTSNAPGYFPPTTATIPKGSTTGTFPITTSPVSTPVNVLITASFQGGYSQASVTITTASISSVTLSPTSVAGGNPSTGTVTLGGTAPSGGITVNLSSSTASAKVPSSVTINGGATSATFTVMTTGVASQVSATITASAPSAGSAKGTLTITPAILSVLGLNPTSVAGGNTSTGTIVLSGQAPSGGLAISVSSSSADATVPSTVTVPAGSSTTIFMVKTSAVTSTVSATITAKLGSANKTATLTITPPALSSVTLNPTTVVGGSSSTGTVTLSGLAPTGGTVVTLSSSSASVTVPASVTVLAGASTATFTAKTVAVGANVSVTITAKLGTTAKTATLTVDAPTLSGLSLNPTSVVGGNSSTGTVTISSAAPVGGLTITLSSSSSDATLPATVTIAAGATSNTFTVKTVKVTTQTSSTIGAKLGATTKSATLTITS
jgi:uncharacterized repeat protein (TIGR03803 family)